MGGEPNDWGRATGQGSGSHEGENYVEMDLRPGRSPPGGENPDTNGRFDLGVPENQGWNDEHLQGVGAHDVIGSGSVNHDAGCFGCQGTYGMYFLCETATPPAGGAPMQPMCSPSETMCWKAPYCPSDEIAPSPPFYGTPSPPPVHLDNEKCGFEHDPVDVPPPVNGGYPLSCTCATGCGAEGSLGR